VNRKASLGAAVAMFLPLALLLEGCGYHVAGRATGAPAEWRTIAIPAFKNDTTHDRIEQRFTEAVIREFIARTKYRIAQDPASADAVLHGEILSIDTSPVLFNATTGEVTAMLVTVQVKVELDDNVSKKAVYQNSDMTSIRFPPTPRVFSTKRIRRSEECPAILRRAAFPRFSRAFNAVRPGQVP
jgi:outer membrane lipopolysaccharide assembly protein LptE/RlpB